MLKIYRGEYGLSGCEERAEAVRERLSGLVRIPPSEIVMRRALREDEDISALADSIRRYGVLQPLLVYRTEAGETALIAGRRRLMAALRVGLLSVPCLYTEADGEESAELALVSNLTHRGMGAAQEAEAISHLLAKGGVSRGELARRLSVSSAYVENKLCLLGLGESLARLLLERGLSEAHARSLLRLEDEGERRELLLFAADGGLSADELARFTEERLREKERRPLRRRMRGALGDLRMLYNSIERALEAARRAGLSAESERSEEGETVELKIRIRANG